MKLTLVRLQFCFKSFEFFQWQHTITPVSLWAQNFPQMFDSLKNIKWINHSLMLLLIKSLFKHKDFVIPFQIEGQ